MRVLRCSMARACSFRSRHSGSRLASWLSPRTTSPPSPRRWPGSACVLASPSSRAARPAGFKRLTCVAQGIGDLARAKRAPLQGSLRPPGGEGSPLARRWPRASEGIPKRWMGARADASRGALAVPAHASEDGECVAANRNESVEKSCLGIGNDLGDLAVKSTGLDLRYELFRFLEELVHLL